MKLTLRVAAVLVAGAVLLPAVPSSGQPRADIEPYRGLGAWVDIFDGGLYQTPEATVADLAGRGVRTLYLETASYRLPGPIRFPDLAGRFLDAAHAAGMRVVGWYVPDFVDLERDLDWSLSAVQFASPAGERFDSFALDIEVTAVQDPNERASRLLQLSSAIRQAVGPGYPLGAITPSPLRSAGYWPVFPDAELAAIYDVYLPMAYSSYHVEGEAGTYDYTAQAAQVVRQETARPDIPIHMIGGISNGLDGPEMQGFVRAVGDQQLMGASLYDVGTSGPEDWAALSTLRFAQPAPEEQPKKEKRDRPERLRLGQDLGTYGAIPDADRSFERAVSFVAGSYPGTWEIDYEAFDLSAGEAEVMVNGDPVAGLPPTDQAAWGPRSTVGLPGDALSGGRNQVTFEVDPEAPGAGETWAVRRVTLVGSALGLDDRNSHGAMPQSDPGREDRTTYEFSSDGSPTAVVLRGFDVIAGEVTVLLNGRLVGALRPSPQASWGDPQTIVLGAPFLSAGVNRLTIDGEPEQPWGVRLERSAGVALI